MLERLVKGLFGDHPDHLNDALLVIGGALNARATKQFMDRILALENGQQLLEQFDEILAQGGLWPMSRQANDAGFEDDINCGD